jgi:uncharacterized membrane protein YozB (DUF420 family)
MKGICMNDRKSLVKVGLLIVLFSWLFFTVYWFFKGLSWIPQAVNYTLLIDFLTEGAGTLGFILRIGAVTLAILALANFLKGKEISKIMRLISFAVVLEALYFLCFTPSAILGFQAGLGLAGGHTLISGESGGLWFFIETAIPTLVEAIIMPISLLKLRSKLTPDAKFNRETFKWVSVVGVCYFIVFWLTYLTQWIASFVQPESYASLYPGYGLGYILEYPLNMFTFILTAVGLPLLAVFFLCSTLPAMRDPAAGIDLRRLGVTLTLLGGYFITIILLFRIFGYVGGPSIWIVFFMFNNADLWCVTLPALGIPLILLKKRMEK